ncbi:MAG: hypothetical protein A3A13_03110 [Candidatus Yanofskybacteria bacterium RIFCSPLOWO2_01_FULL_43_22]|uniref:Membrane insertase YidC/Oxa/ALB C-terminal domain-containing protein n=1 Tax=Candidatus Yanofskybacteria bacterium RIFCSPLOWO2_01_FULL_43_22 TaxID=1802695 RepID=A0A1F8GJE4_9BACT|nr:MAG: hypothetical protein A3A13_03110 [Candidatus Yanofskybacteria bacterium RIFCSPLOWO2_01_FULL_43_22]
MFGNIYTNFVYEPLYNGLVFLLSLLPEPANAGIAIILFTVVVKVVLLPLSRVAIETQLKMKEIEPELSKIKAQYKGNREQLSLKTMALYKEKGINPFSGFFLILIQIPIIFALYKIFLFGGLPEFNFEFLYSFTPVPAAVNMSFLGTDLVAKSYIFALLAGVSQFLQAKYAMPPMSNSKSTEKSFQNDLARSMHMQMKYVLPIFVFFISYHIAAAASLYWIASNIFAIFQELVLRKKIFSSSSQNIRVAKLK